MGNLDFATVLGYWQTLLHGLATSLQLAATCVVIGTPVGFLITIGRVSRSRVLRSVTALYVEIVRGTPVLILLFWVFFCLPPILNVEIDNAISSILALSVYMAAVTSETFRGALKSIGADQHDACAALGLSWRVRVLHVLVPQVLIFSIPTLLSNVVSLFKESALVSAVGVVDLMYVGENISSATAHPIEVLTAVALLYFVVGFALTRVVSRAERRVRIRFQV